MGTHPCPSRYVDARKHRRYKVDKAGEVRLSDSLVSPVTITELSVGGARLRLGTTILLPGAFLLLIKAEELIVPVEVKWRRGDELGVEFIGQPQRADSTGQ
jgi:hypothetical protein